MKPEHLCESAAARRRAVLQRDGVAGWRPYVRIVYSKRVKKVDKYMKKEVDMR